MARSLWKGPFVDGYLLKKAEAARGAGRNEVIKIWSRRSTILPQFVGLTFGVYNGQKHIPVNVSEDMVGTSSASSRRPAPSTATRRTRRRRGSKMGKAALPRCRTTRRRPSRACSRQPAEAEPRAALIRGKKVAARSPTSSSPASASRDVKKCLESAIANAENNHNLDVDDLVVSRGLRRQGARHEALPRPRPRPRRPHREAVLEPHDRGAEVAPNRHKGEPDGSESQPDRSSARHQPDLGQPLVRRRREYAKLMHEDMAIREAS
jgi:small subunit ribosomal protein S19